MAFAKFLTCDLLPQRRAQSTRRNIRKTSLLLSYKGLGDDLAGVCRTITTGRITNLDLSGNEIDVEGAYLLASAIQTGKCSLTSLFLSYNRIRDEGACSIGAALAEKCPSLTILDLTRNRIGDAGFRQIILATQTGKSSLTKLNIWGNNIGNDGAHQLALALQSGNCSLIDLNIGSLIDAEGAYDIAAALQTGKHSLKSLSLSTNTLINHCVSKTIAASLHFSRPLSQVIKYALLNYADTCNELKALLLLAAHFRYADGVNDVLCCLVFKRYDSESELENEP
eukprot:c7497_g1_i2.p1 GENE.c7497_g1_i2~~c7497_g1_i2.p1  ORF type:complete len:282 (+),score=25.24 c7497_g1_i2:38-883(+)